MARLMRNQTTVVALQTSQLQLLQIHGEGLLRLLLLRCLLLLSILRIFNIIAGLLDRPTQLAKLREDFIGGDAGTWTRISRAERPLKRVTSRARFAAGVQTRATCNVKYFFPRT